jgi:hypothetical protein
MPTANSASEVVPAALLVIGGKILSGRTKDQNIGYIAAAPAVKRGPKRQVLTLTRWHHEKKSTRPLWTAGRPQHCASADDVHGFRQAPRRGNREMGQGLPLREGFLCKI